MIYSLSGRKRGRRESERECNSSLPIFLALPGKKKRKDAKEKDEKREEEKVRRRLLVTFIFGFSWVTE